MLTILVIFQIYFTFLELAEGFYLVNTGGTGVATSFITIGAIYAAIIGTAAMTIRRAQPGKNFEICF
jgi:hypothetical protein